MSWFTVQRLIFATSLATNLRASVELFGFAHVRLSCAFACQMPGHAVKECTCRSHESSCESLAYQTNGWPQGGCNLRRCIKRQVCPSLIHDSASGVDIARDEISLCSLPRGTQSM